ncbi:hypothetical protein [Streptomyces sp. NPDC003483]
MGDARGPQVRRASELRADGRVEPGGGGEPPGRGCTLERLRATYLELEGDLEGDDQ